MGGGRQRRRRRKLEMRNGGGRGQRCRKIHLWHPGILYDGCRAPGKRSADGEGDTGVVFWTDIFSALSKCSPATRQFFRNNTAAVLFPFTARDLS